MKSLYGARDASQVFQTYVAENLSDNGFNRNAAMPCLYWSETLEALGSHWGDDFLYAVPDYMGDHLEAMMREVFKVRSCVRVGPGFEKSAPFLNRTISWKEKGFVWTHDQTHTAAMAKALGFHICPVEQGMWAVSVAPRRRRIVAQVLRLIASDRP